MSQNARASSASNLSTPNLRRTRVACKACNARRVKCDVGEGQPCWHCRTRQTNCELIESKRGKYSRRKTLRSHSRSSAAGNIIVQSSPVGSSRIDSPGPSQAQTQQAQPVEQAEDSIAAIGLTSDSQPTRPVEQVSTQQTTGHPADISEQSHVVEVTYNLAHDGSRLPLKIHYPIPASIVHRPSAPQGTALEEPVNIRDALKMPPRPVMDELIQIFFTIIHPAYPVLDRSTFSRLYTQGQASPLILHTTFLLGFTLGTERLIQAAGYQDRYTARRTHYLRAKVLYDADYEKDRILVVTALFLLGFSWFGPDDQKDVCYWTCCATSIAQSICLHRSMTQGQLSSEAKSLRRRLWWAIYTRDRHLSAAFGQPFHIRDEDCDVEKLTIEDMNFDLDYDQSLIPMQQDYHVSYVLAMSELAMILGDILTAEFSPRCLDLEKYKTNTLNERLSIWGSSLPPLLRLSMPSKFINGPYWASMLHLSYELLLFRPRSPQNLQEPTATTTRGEQASVAANIITRIAEDLLAAGMIQQVLVHIIPALFSALSIHTLAIWGSSSVQRQLAETKSRVCLLALSELSETWPVRVWIARAFVNLLRRLAGQSSDGGQSNFTVVARKADNASNSAGKRNRQSGSRESQPITHSLDNTLETMNSNFPLGANSTQPPLRTMDQLFHDSIWAGYLDSPFDADSMLNLSLWNNFNLPPEAQETQDDSML